MTLIRLVNLTKRFRSGEHKTVVANGINYWFDKKARVALLGRNGAGKSSLLRLISGVMKPDSGRVFREGQISWPIGLSGKFRGELSADQNVRMVADIYDRCPDATSQFVKKFCEIEHYFDSPIRSYSSGMKAKVSFGLAMAFQFDYYLVDETTSVGDQVFKNKAKAYLDARLENSGCIFVTHSTSAVRRYCNEVLVLNNGKLIHFDNIDEGIYHYKNL